MVRNANRLRGQYLQLTHLVCNSYAATWGTLAFLVPTEIL